MRIRNKNYFTYWAMCNAAAVYGQSETGYLSSFFGIAVHRTTVSRSLQTLVPYHEIMKKASDSLKASGFFGVSAFDNAQEFVAFKFQRNGESSGSIIVTARFFLEPKIPESYDALVPCTSRVQITYQHQSIPSTYGMPMYEAMNMLEPSSFTLGNNNTDPNEIDVTGDRVESYYEMAMTAAVVTKFQRLIPRSDYESFAFMDREGVVAIQKLSIASKLKRNKYEIFQNTGLSFNSYMSLFQTFATKEWRGTMPKSSMIIPPISPEDETTKKGAGKVILSLLALFGILEATEHEGTSGNVKGLKLADNYQTRFLMVIGDGLSQVRARSFEELVQEVSHSYGKQYDASMTIQKALKQIIHVPGDLHGGCFHFLSAIYSLFYGSLIQPIQILLGWKRIRGSDVTKCYQQAAGLALMASTEFERHLFHAFFKEIYQNPDMVLEIIRTNDAPALALKLASKYQEWFKTKRSTTKDEYFQSALNFVSMMERYRVFRISLRAGDAIMLEALYSKFLSIYNALGKKHYVEIVLGNIDAFYSQLPSKLLHLVRINRTSPLYEGNDRQGKPMANWALDAIIEVQQKYYHRMQQGTSVKGWLQNSPHIMLMNKAQRFVQYEYCRVKEKQCRDSKMVDHVDGDVRMDHGQNQKRTFIPKRHKEYKCISEFISLMKWTVETNGRKYNSKDVWDVIVEERVTTKLNNQDERAQASMMLNEALTEEERLCSSVTDDLFDSIEREDTSTTDENLDVIEEVTLDPLSMVNDGGGEGDDDVEVQDIEEVCVTLKKMKVTKAAINPLGLRDVFTIADELLDKKNLLVTRLRKKERQKRKMDLRHRMFESVRNNADGSETMNEVALEGFRRLRI
jgi:hypothetical protein